MKYIEWLNIWLNNYIKPSAKERTYIRYEQLIRTHIAPKIGVNDVNDLTPIVLQSFVTELLNNGNLKTGKELSANFVNMVISVMQNSLKTAHLVGIANEYTANKIKRPRTKEKQVECFSCQEQKKIYKKTGKNVGITIIKIIFCFLAICLFLFLLIKDIAMILLLAGSLIATVIFLIIYYQRQLNMICPKKKDGSSEYLQKVAFLEDEIAVSGDLNNIVCKIAYKRIKKYYSSQHYYIFKTRGGLLFCVEKSKISPADREKLAELFRTKMPQLKIPWELQQSIYGR